MITELEFYKYSTHHSAEGGSSFHSEISSLHFSIFLSTLQFFLFIATIFACMPFLQHFEFWLFGFRAQTYPFYPHSLNALGPSCFILSWVDAEDSGLKCGPVLLLIAPQGSTITFLIDPSLGLVSLGPCAFLFIHPSSGLPLGFKAHFQSCTLFPCFCFGN